jgi:alpha-aminoadipate/glutamate carrier protein LysW
VGIVKIGLTTHTRNSKYYQVAGIPAPLRHDLTEGAMVLCPECESDLDIEVDEVDEGEIVSCPECGSDFEVVTTEPLELTKVSDEEDEDEKEEEAESGNGDLA